MSRHTINQPLRLYNVANAGTSGLSGDLIYETSSERIVFYSGSGPLKIGSTSKQAIFRFNSNLFTEQQQSFRGVISELSGYFTNGLDSVSFEVRLDTSSTWTSIADLSELQTWINTNIVGNSLTGTIYWIKVLATYGSGETGIEEYALNYI